jgi:hypothetical protein
VADVGLPGGAYDAHIGEYRAGSRAVPVKSGHTPAVMGLPLQGRAPPDVLGGAVAERVPTGQDS